MGWGLVGVLFLVVDTGGGVGGNAKVVFECSIFV